MPLQLTRSSQTDFNDRFPELLRVILGPQNSELLENVTAWLLKSRMSFLSFKLPRLSTQGFRKVFRAVILNSMRYAEVPMFLLPNRAYTYLALRSSSPCQDNGQQEFAICACL